MGFILKLYPCSEIAIILYLSPQFFFKIQNRALKIRGAFFSFRKVLQLKINNIANKILDTIIDLSDNMSWNSSFSIPLFKLSP